LLTLISFISRSDGKKAYKIHGTENLFWDDGDFIEYSVENDSATHGSEVRHFRLRAIDLEDSQRSALLGQIEAIGSIQTPNT
jgi:hypothetical protein